MCVVSAKIKTRYSEYLGHPIIAHDDDVASSVAFGIRGIMMASLTALFPGIEILICPKARSISRPRCKSMRAYMYAFSRSIYLIYAAYKGCFPRGIFPFIHRFFDQFAGRIPPRERSRELLKELPNYEHIENRSFRELSFNLSLYVLYSVSLFLSLSLEQTSRMRA